MVSIVFNFVKKPQNKTKIPKQKNEIYSWMESKGFLTPFTFFVKFNFETHRLFLVSWNSSNSVFSIYKNPWKASRTWL